jgi:ATP-dependent Clp protease ATP-binding subunit ClpC
LFERFSERARQVVVLAQDEARALGHGYIGTEHLLLGLLREEEGLAARALEGLKVDLETARGRVAGIVGRGPEAPRGQIPFTRNAQRSLELSLREALSLGHGYIGTEHVLLGLLRAKGGVALRVLREFDLHPEEVRATVLRLFQGPDAPTAEVEYDDYADEGWWGGFLLQAGLIFAVALALGVLVGWLLWG